MNQRANRWMKEGGKAACRSHRASQSFTNGKGNGVGKRHADQEENWSWGSWQFGKGMGENWSRGTERAHTHPNTRTVGRNISPRRGPPPSSAAAPSAAVIPATVSPRLRVLLLRLRLPRRRRRCRRMERSREVRLLHRRWVWMLVGRLARLDIGNRMRRRGRPFLRRALVCVFV